MTSETSDDRIFTNRNGICDTADPEHYDCAGGLCIKSLNVDEPITSIKHGFGYDDDWEGKYNEVDTKSMVDLGHRWQELYSKFRSIVSNMKLLKSTITRIGWKYLVEPQQWLMYFQSSIDLTVHERQEVIKCDSFGTEILRLFRYRTTSEHGITVFHRHHYRINKYS